MKNTVNAFVLTFLLLSSAFAQEKFKLNTFIDLIQKAFESPEVSIEQYQFPADSDTVKSVAVDTARTVPTQKIAVAILELDPNGISIPEGKALSDRLRIEVFNVGVFEVMEREKMTKILDEMQFQLSGCTTDECAVEIGRMIGVSKMIAGSVSKVSEFYTVSIRLIDVETGKIEATALEDVEGSLGFVLTKAIPSVAMQISGLEKPELFVPRKKTAFNIVTDPIDAEVYIDGLYKGQSPVEVEVEPGYMHRVRATKNDYEVWEKSYKLEKDQLMEIDIVLPPKPAPIVNESDSKPREKSFRQGFKIRWVKTQLSDKINTQIHEINLLKDSGTQLFKETIDPTENSFSQISSFNGIEFHNVRQPNRNFAIDFGIGVYRGNFGKWFSNVINDKHSDDVYTLATWSPQVMFDLKFAPISYPFLYPYVNVGFGYNLLVMTAYRNEHSIGGPIYQSWGFMYGAGVEVRPFRFIGVAFEWNRKNMNMSLLDVDRVTDYFKTNNLSKIDLTGTNVSLSLNLYY
ncbi:MAG: PEGA domain-containing protein [Candidatus Neomarinimicrobiota bacterium]